MIEIQRQQVVSSTYIIAHLNWRIPTSLAAMQEKTAAAIWCANVYYSRFSPFRTPLYALYFTTMTAHELIKWKISSKHSVRLHRAPIFHTEIVLSASQIPRPFIKIFYVVM